MVLSHVVECFPSGLIRIPVDLQLNPSIAPAVGADVDHAVSWLVGAKLIVDLLCLCRVSEIQVSHGVVVKVTSILLFSPAVTVDWHRHHCWHRRCKWSDEMFSRVVGGVVVILVLSHVGCAQRQIVVHMSLPLAWLLLGPPVVARSRSVVGLVSVCHP